MTPYETLAELESDALIRCGEASHKITFDGNILWLWVIFERNEPATFIYRRGGLDLTRDQAAELIRRNYQHHGRR